MLIDRQPLSVCVRYSARLKYYCHFIGDRRACILATLSTDLNIVNMSYLTEEKANELASQLDVEKSRIEEWYAAFQIFDANKDGHISSTELTALLRQIFQDPTEEQAQEMITALDENKSGQIEFPEFCKHMKTQYKTNGEKSEELKAAFQIFDKDGNNFISADELMNLMQTFGERLSEEEAKEMIAVADVNSDGKIDYNEFVKMMYP
ncbi:hypothetical protein CAPTEDRAFT_166289 [Capitella teleta]|uniref:EF-hand domain-containing protein n=1 Tax=Capitella teleta TaxID=283909 RepID=R7U145_CAPTE|nr:hypothetical protein CAPTEDRAFT_166289 [Capitella teleta]|eukprot:ELT99719.1 hypothetical protein CAPTEDRAFT_166289 [Capitella teleta]